MRKSIILAAAALMLAQPSLARGPKSAAQVTASVSGDPARIDAVLDRIYPSLNKIYMDLHAHPEIAFRETRSAAILAANLRRMGFDVTEAVGTTGVVGVLRNGDGPTVLMRTDMDGLPMEERTGLPYASRHSQLVDGKPQLTAHSCGHDIHMSWWLGAAEILASMKDRWAGTVVFVGQPAEETTSGAKAMLSDRFFERFPKPDFGFAAHVIPAPAGMILLKAGNVTSSSDAIEITFNGKGAHGSAPDESIDPIIMGSRFVSDVQTVISREKEAGTFGVITVGSFQAGEVGNIIPDHATLRLTLRSQSANVRDKLIRGVTRTAKAVSDMAGAPPPTILHTPGGTAVRNDERLVQKIQASLSPAFGSKLVLMPSSAPAFSASEDYSNFVEAGIPSVYYWIGGYDTKVIGELAARGEKTPINHSPYFAPSPEPSIRSGSKALAISVLSVAPPRP